MAPIKRLKMALCHTPLCLLCFIAMPQGAGAQTVAEEYQIKASPNIYNLVSQYTTLNS